MRFREIFTPVQFVEAVLLIAAIVTLFGLNDRKIPIGLLTASLLFNLTDRVLISQNKKDRILQQPTEQSKLISTDAEEVRSRERQDSNTTSNTTQVEKELTLVELEKRIAPLESRNEQLIKIQTLFDALQTAPQNFQAIHEKLQNSEDILEQLIRQSQTKETINQLLEHIRTIRPHTYELVWNMEASHEIFIEALESFQYRLILVNPWLSEYAFTPKIKQKFRDALNKPNTRIFIGWGFWGDVYDKKSLNPETKIEFNRFEFKKLSDQRYDDPNRVTWKYKALNWLSDLEEESSGKLTLKLLYTHQKYLVCDNQFTMIGSHNFLTSKPSKTEHGRSPDAEVGIRTTDPALIKEIVNKYGEARNWDLHSHRP
ncbi:MAG: hypothetical protein HC852_11205 [Acaryochloridaceae cyanobacterium RU_4_10]|nr:hypothetical protein [Acaryochloridaceae cyanobacterium RU_4_10]